MVMSGVDAATGLLVIGTSIGMVVLVMYQIYITAVRLFWFWKSRWR